MALPFTRGEKVSLIDMNQDGYIEEAFKIRNLLEEFDPPAPKGGPPRAPGRRLPRPGAALPVQGGRELCSPPLLLWPVCGGGWPRRENRAERTG